MKNHDGEIPTPAEVAAAISGPERDLLLIIPRGDVPLTLRELEYIESLATSTALRAALREYRRLASHMFWTPSALVGRDEFFVRQRERFEAEVGAAVNAQRGRYSGEIIGTSHGYVLQNVESPVFPDRPRYAHNPLHLYRVPAVGERVTIQYQGGRGQVVFTDDEE